MGEMTQKDLREHLALVGSESGFFETLGAQHSAVFVKGSAEGGKTLIVTFENLDDIKKDAEDRMPWGYGFVTSQGWSMLGLMAHGWTWYRDESVFDFFDRLRDEKFFEQFDTVVFYGASMGAYAASVFSAAAPGATVVLLSPQATLSRDVASWETRYRKAWKRDFSTRYAYGPEQSKLAHKVHLFYDPLASLDAMHAALFQGENVTKYKCRFMGHRIASLWQRMSVLKKVVLGCVEDKLDEGVFYTLMRARLHNQRYQREMLDRLVKMNRPYLVAQYTQSVLNTRGGPVFRKALKKATAELAAKKK